MGVLRFLTGSPCHIDRDIAAGIQDLRPMISYEVYYFLRNEGVMPDPFLFKILIIMVKLYKQFLCMFYAYVMNMRHREETLVDDSFLIFSWS